MILAVSGKATAGKDTFFEMMNESLKDVVNVKFADHLYDLTEYLYQIENLREKKYVVVYNNLTGRQLLQQVGEKLREIDPYYFVKRLKLDDDMINVVTDVRYKNELEYLKMLGATTIRINRDVPKLDHISETDLDDENFDIVIENNGDIEDFRREFRDKFLKLYLLSCC